MRQSPKDVPPPLNALFWVFLRIGLLSFGGPAAQIALMHRELVERRNWLDEESFLRGLSFCMLLPGPEAMQLCTYTGWRLRGVLGGLLAGLLFVLPGAVVIALLTWAYASFGRLSAVEAAFSGIKAAVIVIVLQALWRLKDKALHGAFDWSMAGFGFIALFCLGLPFPVVILVAGGFGLMRGQPQQSASLPPPPHARHRQTIRTAVIWALLWLVPLAMIELWGSVFLADLGWFFSKLAVVTFGGAYAVLAYMSQTVVEQYGWINSGQMIDALGLAETTPGPLILVTQFVAMLAGLLEGGLPLFLAAGAVALWATFVPCFLWIFTAAPYVERLAQRPRLGTALKAITATVCGVILNLALWFMAHVLFDSLGTFEFGPFSVLSPDWSSLEPRAALLTLLALGMALLLRGRLLVLLILMATAGFLMSFEPINAILTAF